MNQVGLIQQYIVTNAIDFVIGDVCVAIGNPRLPCVLDRLLPTPRRNEIISGVIAVQ